MRLLRIVIVAVLLWPGGAMGQSPAAEDRATRAARAAAERERIRQLKEAREVAMKSAGGIAGKVEKIEGENLLLQVRSGLGGIGVVAISSQTRIFQDAAEVKLADLLPGAEALITKDDGVATRIDVFTSLGIAERGDRPAIERASALANTELNRARKLLMGRKPTEPNDWVSVDLDPGKSEGKSRKEDGRIIIECGDETAPIRQDRAHFYGQAVQGDCELTARIRQDISWQDGQAGLMIREGEVGRRSSEVHAQLLRGGDRTTTLRGRDRKAGRSLPHSTAERISVGATWLKLIRIGDRVHGFESADGEGWWPVGEIVIPMIDEAGIYIGLVASGPGTSGRWVFDEVELKVYGPGAVQAGEAGIVKLDGTFVAGEVISLDERAVVLRTADGEQKLDRAAIARIALAPMSRALRDKLDAAPAGILLHNGDFVEGQVRSISRGEITISSLLFGLRRMEVRREVAGIILAGPQ